MALNQQDIDVGTSPNNGQGDPIRTAFTKTNNNFSQLYSIPQSSPPTTLTGTTGDFAGMYAYDSTYFYYCFANYTGNSTIWAQITQAGNVSVTAINNGNSNVAINGSGANAIVSIGGTSNVAVFATSGVYLSGVVSAAGNVRGGNLNTVGNVTGNYILGNGSLLTGLSSTYSNANVVTLLANFGSNSISTTGNVTANYLFGNGSQLTGLPATYGNANVANYLPVYSGNIASNNISTSNTISATGNIITSGYFVGTFAGNVTGNFVVPGSNTQVIFNTSGNADATAGMTYDKGTNTFVILGVVSSQGNTIGGNIVTAGLITAAGNIYAGNIINTGVSSVTGNITGGNILTAGLVSATGNVRGGNIVTAGSISTTGNIYAGNVINTGVSSVTGNILTTGLISATGNIRGDNLLTAGFVSASGNVTGNYFIGNGSQLTGLPASYGNSNVSTFLAAFGSNTISTTGTITSGNITGGNVLTGGIISATGNITGNYILGNGSQLTGLPATYGNSNVTTLLSGFGSNTISTSGNITSGNLSVGTGTITVNNIINSGSNATGNIGSSSNYFNTVFATATTALYADLAECYLADAAYAPGTVVSFGGEQEITLAQQDHDTAVAGVVSTQPAYQMNSGLTGDHVVTVALIGRVPCQVRGPVRKGALMVSAGNGRARAETNPAPGAIIGKAVQSFDGDVGTIEIVVGRV
jgi:hypothetical protein